MTTVGDMIIGGTSGAPARLAAGTSAYVLTSNGVATAPSWQAAAGGGCTTNCTIGTSATTGVPLTINGYSGAQSGDFFQVWNYAGGSKQFYVASSGQVNFGGLNFGSSNINGLSVLSAGYGSALGFATNSANSAAYGYSFNTSNPFWTALSTSAASNYFLVSSGMGNTSTTYTGAWGGINDSITFGNGTTTVYNSSTPAAAFKLTPTVNWSTASTGGYTEIYSKPVETSVSAGVTNYFIQHFASGGSTPNWAVTEAGYETTSSLNVITARKGTFVCTAAGTITISNTNELVTSDVIISLNTAGGTISTAPAMKTVSTGSGFTVLCGAADTSTYNYSILN
jgi:hypothetical protein